jgi:hypothetical protein
MAGNKYGAKKTVIDGITFDSKKEARRYTELKLLERAGEIRGLKLKPVFPIVVNGRPVMMRNGHVAKYTADFQYFEGIKSVVEEVKGYVVRDYPLRRALVEHIYHVKIRES